MILKFSEKCILAEYFPCKADGERGKQCEQHRIKKLIDYAPHVASSMTKA